VSAATLNIPDAADQLAATYARLSGSWQNGARILAAFCVVGKMDRDGAGSVAESGPRSVSEYADSCFACLHVIHAMEKGLGRRMTDADGDRSFGSLLDEISGRHFRMLEERAREVAGTSGSVEVAK
jgi:hypothetical protein